VKSVKTVTGTRETERETLLRKPLSTPDRVKVEGRIAAGTFRIRTFETETEPTHEFVLSEDQQKTADVVKEIASRYGLEVEVVDVARENVLHRAIQKEFEKIRIFPTLIVSSGEKIEGKVTKEQIESFLSCVL
jgi:predicted DsbA family dithiol-disulfide isomerase